MFKPMSEKELLTMSLKEKQARFDHLVEEIEVSLDRTLAVADEAKSLGEGISLVKSPADIRAVNIKIENIKESQKEIDSDIDAITIEKDLLFKEINKALDETIKRSKKIMIQAIGSAFVGVFIILLLNVTGYKSYSIIVVVAQALILLYLIREILAPDRFWRPAKKMRN